MKIWLLGLAVGVCLGLAHPAAAQGAKAGDAYFQQNCAVCHSTDTRQSAGQGPGLFGVVGRKIGTAPGFGYSPALQKAGKSGEFWTEATLDAFLADPDKARPGTAMPVNVPEKSDRDSLIAYLKTLNGPPATGKVRKLSDFPDMPPQDVAAAQARAKAEGYDIWTEARPGTTHRITVASLPKPLATKNVSNPAKIVARPATAWPQVPSGFEVTIFSQDVIHPRNMVVAPNGDVFVAETAKGRIKVLSGSGKAVAGSTSVFAEGLNGPYGMAFYPSGDHPQYLYVADALKVVRYPYANGDLVAGSAPEVIVAALVPGVGGHATRTIAFTPDDKFVLVSIGAATNVANPMPKTPPEPIKDWEGRHGVGAAWAGEFERAAILRFDPDGKNRKAYALGLRNCVGMVIHPVTHDLLCTNNERDYIGDDLPPDFFTRVPGHAFFGWPWYYIGDNPDPRHAGERPDLIGKIRVPDLLIQPHSAPLGVAIYQAPPNARSAFGAAYDGDAFIALHGSGNRTLRTGQKIIRVRMKDGVPADSYEDFMTGFIVDNNSVWGKPVAVVVAADGALLVSDDVSNTIWRIAPKE